MRRSGRESRGRIAAAGLVAIALLSTGAGPRRTAQIAASRRLSAGSRFGFGADFDPGAFRVDQPAPKSRRPGQEVAVLDPRDVMRTAQTVALFGLISLAPVAVLMVTAFVRINIVLILLRQALGSPQVPGQPGADGAGAPAHGAGHAARGRDGLHPGDRALHPGPRRPRRRPGQAGSAPIKAFMVEQISRRSIETTSGRSTTTRPRPAPARPSRVRPRVPAPGRGPGVPAERADDGAGDRASTSTCRSW